MLLKQFAAILISLALPGIAFAEAAAPPPGPSGLMQIIFLGGFVLIFYLLVWRPQSKRAKEHKELVNSISKGDEVLISGALAGKVARLKDDFMLLEVADKVEIKVQRGAVTSVLPKGTLKDI